MIDPVSTFVIRLGTVWNEFWEAFRGKCDANGDGVCWAYCHWMGLGDCHYCSGRSSEEERLVQPNPVHNVRDYGNYSSHQETDVP